MIPPLKKFDDQNGIINLALVLLIIFGLFALSFAAYHVLNSTNIYDTFAANGCPDQTTRTACESRGCVNNTERCYWNTSENRCRKKYDKSCGGGSTTSSTSCTINICPTPSCDDSASERAYNDERCIKVKVSGATYCSGFRRPYCCPHGKITTHYDKRCCLPQDVVYLWNENYPPGENELKNPTNTSGGWDTACGCPSGKICYH